MGHGRIEIETKHVLEVVGSHGLKHADDAVGSAESRDIMPMPGLVVLMSKHLEKKILRDANIFTAFPLY